MKAFWASVAAAIVIAVVAAVILEAFGPSTADMYHVPGAVRL